MNKIIYGLFALAVMFTGTAMGQAEAKAEKPAKLQLEDGIYAEFTTTKGVIPSRWS